MSEKTLVLINGPWQALSVLSTLSMDYEGGDKNVILLLVDMDKESPIFNKTVDILKVMDWHHFSIINDYSNTFQQNKNLLNVIKRNSLKKNSFDKIYTFGFHRPVVRWILNYFKEYKIHLYEEGMRSYVDPLPLFQLSIRESIKSFLGILFPPFRGFHYNKAWLNQIETFHKILDDSLLAISDHYLCSKKVIEAERVHSILGHLSSTLNLMNNHKEPVEKPYVLIIGQYYFRLNQLSKEYEQDLYLKAVKKIIENGYTPLWRGHIRGEDPFYPALSQAYPEVKSFNELFENPSYPLELYIPLLEKSIHAVMGIASTSLLYCFNVFKIPAFRLVDDEDISKFTYPHSETVQTIAEILPFMDSAF